MISEAKATAESYDRLYRRQDYFRYNPRLYRKYIKAILEKAAAKPGGRLLDVGCGQGFFTNMFSSLGLVATGVDLSVEGIATARQSFPSSKATFVVGDILALPEKASFDCVFVRSFSLYSVPDFSRRRDVTAALLGYLKPDGCLVFVYNTNFSRRRPSPGWVYHSLAETRSHFSIYPSAEVFFTLRFATVAFGSRAFSPLMTTLDSRLGRFFGVGGDLIAFVRAPTAP